MKTFNVKIIVTASTSVWIEAEDEEEAREIAQQQIDDGDIEHCDPQWIEHDIESIQEITATGFPIPT